MVIPNNYCKTALALQSDVSDGKGQMWQATVNTTQGIQLSGLHPVHGGALRTNDGNRKNALFTEQDIAGKYVRRARDEK